VGAVLTLASLSLAFAGVADASTWTTPLQSGSAGEAQAQTLPAAPTGVTSACVTPTSNRQITLTWNTVAHATKYTVWQSFKSGAYTSVATVTTTTWTSSTGLAVGTYSYEIKTQIGNNWIGALSSPSTTRTITASSCS
jgi:hypothetical protein